MKNKKAPVKIARGIRPFIIIEGQKPELLPWKRPPLLKICPLMLGIPGVYV